MKRRVSHEGTINYDSKRRSYEGQIRYQKEDGSYGRKHFRGPSKESVQKKMRSFLEGGSRGASADYTVASWLDSWLKTKKLSVKVKTYERYNCTIKAHVLPSTTEIINDDETAGISDYIGEQAVPASSEAGSKDRKWGSALADWCFQ